MRSGASGRAVVLGTIKVVNRTVEKVTDVGLDVAEARFGARDRAALMPALPMRSDVLKSADWIGDAGVGW